ncbi:MAG: glycosyltransferase family 2 protein [Pyrobaculum sp.]|nr:glycosyltransferase family 2 protein [Pyrobaculum sp.]
MVDITFPSITLPRNLLNETLHILNKTRTEPITAPNAPAIPPWLQHMLLSAYFILLLFTLLLTAHYIYYARHARPVNYDPPPGGGGLLSIIIPVKNESADTLLGALRRLSALSCPDAEIIVVSDDPPEKFEELRKAVEEAGIRDVKLLRRPNPVGYKGTALNWAAEQARGDVLLFLDVDSVPPPDLCTRARAVGEKEILFLGWDGYASVETPIATLQLFLYKYLLYYVAILGRHNTGHPVFALGSGIAVRKNFFREIGGFCNCTADDYDISMKAYVHGGRVVYSPGPPVYVEVPAGFHAFKRQYARWTYNSAYILAKYFSQIFKLKMPAAHKLSIFLNVVTHPLMILTTFAVMLAGVAMGYMGIIIPPLHILILQLALFITAALQLFYVYRLAKLDGHSFLEVAGKMAKSAGLLLILSPYLTFYVLLGLLKRRIRWYTTPKGLAALRGGAWGPYEAATVAVFAALLAVAVYMGNVIFATSAAFLLTVALYVYVQMAMPSSRSDTE